MIPYVQKKSSNLHLERTWCGRLFEVARPLPMMSHTPLLTIIHTHIHARDPPHLKSAMCQVQGNE